VSKAAAPADAEALYLQGLEYRTARDHARAEPAFRRALELAPGRPEPAYQLAQVLLAMGRYAEGWPLYELRELRRRRAAFMAGAYPYPEWQGEPLVGKRLLVIGEQGFGDQIMMARFLPRLEAGAVTYAGPPELDRLLSQLPIDYLRTDAAKTRPQADYWAFSMSLAGRLGVTLESVPAAPYLAGQARAATGRIGVAWKGAAYNANDPFRSMPRHQAAALLALPGAISLEPEATGAADFQDTADTIAGLDLVISVDTAVAHLAGAMGKPVWVLLGAHGLDWQWLTERADSPWYPSARLFRQPTAGDWASVVAAVGAELSRG
jgi:tetratricopeptide (TPR) repeat protein